MLGVIKTLSGDGLERFQLAMTLIAASLITQMVFWMRKHGRTLKRDLEAGMALNAERANWWGMLTVVALAVGRESSETVGVFLYGFGFESHSASEWLLTVALRRRPGVRYLLGAALRGSQIVSWRRFFQLSEALLLLLASALVIAAVEK